MRVLFCFIFCFALFFSAFGQKKVGGSAPTFSVTSIDGKTFDSAKLKGKVVVLNLWFVNCPYCVEEIKSLNDVVDEYKNKDVVFIGMATNDKTKVENFLKKNPFKYNIVPSAMQAILSFGEPNKDGEFYIPFPVHVVIDREGKIVVSTNGIKGVETVKNELQRQFKAK